MRAKERVSTHMQRDRSGGRGLDTTARFGGDGGILRQRGVWRRRRGGEVTAKGKIQGNRVRRFNIEEVQRCGEG